MRCLLLLSLLLLLFCPPVSSDTYLVTDEDLTKIVQEAQRAQEQIVTLQHLNNRLTQQCKQEQKLANRYKTLSMILGGVAIGLGATIAIREITK